MPTSTASEAGGFSSDTIKKKYARTTPPRGGRGNTSHTTEQQHRETLATDIAEEAGQGSTGRRPS